MDLKVKILEELSRGDRHPYQLYDVLNLTNYRDLFAAVEQLLIEEKIESYFDDGSLTYKLKHPVRPGFANIVMGLNATNRIS